MARFLLWRVVSAIPTLFGMSLLAFFIVSITPGDPVMQELRAMGSAFSPEDVAAMRAEYNLDKPLPVRYLLWLGDAARGEFGTSIGSGRSVIEEIGIYLPATLTLAASALVGAIAISLTLGIAAVSAPRGAAALLRTVTVVLVSIPSFWLALLLIWVFVLKLGWARLVGDASLGDLVLPTVTLSLAAGASLGRVVHERIRTEMCEDHVRLAIAKGLSPAAILLHHIAPRIIGPLATAWANTLGALLGGAVIVETIFGWPGLGQLVLQAIGQRDYPIIQAYLVFMGLGYFATSLLADVIVIVSDPQLRRDLADD